MKKLLLSALTVGLISTSSMAGWIDGKVTSITQYPDSIRVIVERTSDGAGIDLRIDPASTMTKELLAMFLTAKTSNMDVSAYATDVTGGPAWTSLKLQ